MVEWFDLTGAGAGTCGRAGSTARSSRRIRYFPRGNPLLSHAFSQAPSRLSGLDEHLDVHNYFFSIGESNTYGIDPSP
jgi:hypothetical protein